MAIQFAVEELSNEDLTKIAVGLENRAKHDNLDLSDVERMSFFIDQLIIKGLRAAGQDDRHNAENWATILGFAIMSRFAVCKENGWPIPGSSL